MRMIRRVAAFLAFVTLLGLALGDTGARADPRGGVTVTFPYEQRRYLFSRQGNGGLAYVTEGAARGAMLPTVVFLHGMNATEEMHPWVSGPTDLRPLVERLVESGQLAPLILAAPTHTRYATGATWMWPEFDVEDFLAATEHALGGAAHVDRSRVVLVGHSAAGCNPTGGLIGPLVRFEARRLLAVVAVDTCLDPDIEASLVELSQKTELRVYWQRSWSRSFDGLQRSCQTGARPCTVEEIEGTGGVPHNTILPAALTRALPALLPGPGAPR